MFSILRRQPLYFFIMYLKSDWNGGDLRMSLEMFRLVTMQDRLIIRKSLIRALL